MNFLINVYNKSPHGPLHLYYINLLSTMVFFLYIDKYLCEEACEVLLYHYNLIRPTAWCKGNLEVYTYSDRGRLIKAVAQGY